MSNRHRGEVSFTLDGEARTLRLTLGSLAELEDRLGADGVADLAGRLGSGRLRTRDMAALLAAGLRGGGYEIDEEALSARPLDGGMVAVASAVAALLEATFAEPERG